MSTRSPKQGKVLHELDEMIAEITVDAYGDDEQLWAFRQAFEDDVALPADGFVIEELKAKTTWEDRENEG